MEEEIELFNTVKAMIQDKLTKYRSEIEKNWQLAARVIEDDLEEVSMDLRVMDRIINSPGK